MKPKSCSRFLGIVAGIGFLFLSASAAYAMEPSAEAVADFNAYSAKVEARLAKEHRSQARFLAPEHGGRQRRGDPVIEE